MMGNNSIISFGEVLFDHFPDGSLVLGGAPFNVAWHLQAFGQQPHFISRIGNDEAGQKIRSAMHSWGMNPHLLQSDSKHPTGCVQISIEHGEPSYAILADQAYDYIDFDTKLLNDISHTSIFYHGTLALRSPVSMRTLTNIKALHHGKVFIDVNLRQPWWHKNDVLQLIVDADWVKLNFDEFQALHDNATYTKPCMEAFLNQYNLEGLIVTYGAKGALAFKNSGEFISVTPEIKLETVDTVGAGDAFSAMLLLGLNLDWGLRHIMENAQLFASAITEQRGATVHNMSFYKPFFTSREL